MNSLASCGKTQTKPNHPLAAQAKPESHKRKLRADLISDCCCEQSQGGLVLQSMSLCCGVIDVVASPFPNLTRLCSLTIGVITNLLRFLLQTDFPFSKTVVNNTSHCSCKNMACVCTLISRTDATHQCSWLEGGGQTTKSSCLEPGSLYSIMKETPKTHYWQGQRKGNGHNVVECLFLSWN